MGLMFVSVVFVLWQLDFLQWEAAKPIKRLLKPLLRASKGATKVYQRAMLPEGASTVVDEKKVLKTFASTLSSEMEFSVPSKELLETGYNLKKGDYFKLTVDENAKAEATIYENQWFVIVKTSQWRLAAISGQLRLRAEKSCKVSLVLYRKEQ